MASDIKIEYLNQAKSNEKNYKNTILYISMCCFVITLISALILIPVTLRLDNEQENIIIKWLLINTQCGK